MKSDRLFQGAVILSLLAHGVLLAVNTQDDGSRAAQIIRIPVMLEAEPPPPPPPPPPPEPEEPPKKKVRPKKLAERIEEVVEGDGLRTGELVDAEVGSYDEAAPAASPPPPPPPPKPKPEPKPEPVVDKVALARTYLSQLRSELMSNKKYPLSAQRMGVTGAVTVSFVVAPDSSFTKIAVKRSSGHEILDAAAVATVSKLSGKLRRPKALGPSELKTSVVLRYELNT